MSRCHLNPLEQSTARQRRSHHKSGEARCPGSTPAAQGDHVVEHLRRPGSREQSPQAAYAGGRVREKEGDADPARGDNLLEYGPHQRAEAAPAVMSKLFKATHTATSTRTCLLRPCCRACRAPAVPQRPMSRCLEMRLTPPVAPPQRPSLHHRRSQPGPPFARH